ICDRVEKEPGQRLPLADNRTAIERTFDSLGEQGFRVLGVAYRPAAREAKLSKEEEQGMIFLGFVVLADPPKAGISEVIRRLESTGVRLKILTGDNKEVAHYICHAAFGLEGDVKTGEEIRDLPEKEFARALEETEIFAEIDPLLKERIIRAFRDAGNVVGFLGDGINDTPALHACDASITVNSAVDIAKETSDIVLLEKDLGVLTDGIYEGRKTFANTLKYIFMATSANFGGTFSYLGTAFFLPFLPMLPKQVLVNNLMTDLPALTLPSDSVDRELIDKPQRWNIGFIRRFMITFGLLSSSFDYLTFGTLIFFFRAQEAFFHTGWFVESVVTSVLIVFVIRTRKPFFRSMPGKLLFWTSAADALAICVLFPFSGLGRILEFVPLPASYFAALALIVALFFLSAELTKEFFYRRLLRNTSKGPPGPAIREKQPALSAK
ncbi:MAG: HAD-IC family P-type ATPase, partial [Deltaproteobacteria bacterium]